ncbi:MAG: ABC transporter permease [Velocimicrobium sp.]
MNKIIQFARLDFNQLRKSKTFYFKLILFPSLLIFVLGKALGGTNSTLSVFPIIICNEDIGYQSGETSMCLGNQLIHQVLQSKDVKTYLSLSNTSSYEEGKHQIEQGEAAVFIYLPKNFTSSVLTCEKTNITIISASDKTLEKSIVSSILNQFIQTTQISLLEEQTFLPLLAKQDARSQDAQNKLHSRLETTFLLTIPELSTNLKTIPISAMQYISIGMVVMFSIVTAFTLTHSVVTDKLNATLFRIKSTPTMDLQYIIGKLSGIIVVILIQMLLMILITHLVFQMNWGNPILLFLTTLVYAFTIASFVLMGGLIAKSQAFVSAIASPILYGFSFLGGSFISKNALPESLQSIQKIIPNGTAINCYLSICEGMGLSSIYKELLQLCFTGILFLILTIVLYNGKEFFIYGITHSNKKTIKASV